MIDEAVVQATVRAGRLYRSPGYRKAYIAGARAATTGSQAGNPYSVEEGRTWRTGFRRAWFRGYDSVEVSE